MKKTKKILSVIIALLILMTTFPASVVAAGDQDTEFIQQPTVENGYTAEFSESNAVFQWYSSSVVTDTDVIDSNSVAYQDGIWYVEYPFFGNEKPYITLDLKVADRIIFDKIDYNSDIEYIEIYHNSNLVDTISQIYSSPYIDEYTVESDGIYDFHFRTTTNGGTGLGGGAGDDVTHGERIIIEIQNALDGATTNTLTNYECGKEYLCFATYEGETYKSDPVTAVHSCIEATCCKASICKVCGEEFAAPDLTNHDETIELENGFCPYCGIYEPAELNEDNYYEISNAGQLFWFANYINTVDRTANAVLTADIDLENRPWTPIGSTGENSNNFRGIFDGQNHTIKGLYVEGGRAGLGFFGEVRTGTVKNFTIYGEVVANTDVNYVGGVIGSICGLNGENDLERNGAIIQNITSYVNLTAKTHGIGMIGGFVGYANHESLIENCSWYGTFDAGEYRVDSGAGGFIGKIQENTSAVTIRNCGAYGTIKTNYAKNSYNNTPTIYMGGFLSFSNTGAQTVLENCLFAGKFECGENLTDEARLGAFGTLRSVNAIKNCYYLGDDGLEAVHSDSPLNAVSENIEITSITREQLKSGEVAYLLGEAWGQMSNTEGSLPIITDNELYKVVTVGETGNYSVANVGDTNGDGTVDVNDYQVLVNAILNEDPEQEAVKQIETASYDDIVKYDLDGDGYLDVVDVSLLERMINGDKAVDVYAVGDFNRNGKAFEEADIFAMAEAMKAPEDLETHEKYACDINGDGKVSYDDLNTLTSMFPLYFVGEA
ncbi:MAG: hypothetical protein E7533_03790 [Ruminococcaceae bacterium]|nr:hypothetical protein [Oscillospiraceae bacterium]